MVLTPVEDKTYKTISGCKLAIRNLGLHVISYEVIKSPENNRFHPVFYVRLKQLQSQLLNQGFHARLVQP